MEAKRRLMKEFQRIAKDPPVGISAVPNQDNIFHWTCVICGVEGTLWEDAVLKLTMDFPEEYPRKPPYCCFTTKVFHPNVFLPLLNGGQEICIDILRKNWSPAYDVSAILISIQQLLTDPNPAANANPEACRLYTNDRAEYEKRVRQCVEDSWADN